MCKKAILFCAQSLSKGGAERQVYNLAKYLAANSWQVHIFIRENLCTYGNTSFAKLHIFQDERKIRNKDSDTIWNVIRQLIAINRIIRKNKIKIVYARTYVMYLRVFLSKKIMRWQAAYICSEANAASLNMKKGVIFRTLIKCALMGANSVHALTEKNAADLKKMYNLKRNISVKPVGVDFPKIISDAEKQNHKFDGTPYMISVGRLEPQKNHELAIHAMKYVYSNVPLILLGQGSMKRKYEKIIGELGIEDRVKLLGYRENPYPYIKNAKMFLFSSKYEGYGNALVEAIVLKVPVVSTDFYGMDIKLNKLLKQQGRVVESFDPQQFARVIEKKIRDRSALIEAKSAFLYARKNLSINEVGKSLNNEMQSILGIQ